MLVAPAMNTAMWLHPITARHIQVPEEEWGMKSGDGTGWFEVLYPIEKAPACGDVGFGAMTEWTKIVKGVEQRPGLAE